MKRRTLKLNICFLIGFLLGLMSLPAFAGVNKDQCVKFFKGLKGQYSSELNKLDRDIMSLIQFSPSDDKTSLRARESELLLKKQRRTELSLKVEFLDQLVYQFDRFYSGQPVRPFLMNRMSAMLAREFGLGSTKLDTRDNMVKYLTRIRYGLAKSNAKDAKVFDYIEGQLKVSSLSSPEDIEAFTNRDSYSNGIEQETASEVTLEEAGDYVDSINADARDENVKSLDSANEDQIKEVTREKIPDGAFTRKHLIQPHKQYWKKPLFDRATAVVKDTVL